MNPDMAAPSLEGQKGSHRVRIEHVVQNFFDFELHRGERSAVVRSSEIVGLNGGNSMWRLGIYPKPAAERPVTLFVLCLMNDTDIKVEAQWSVSIVKPGPSGEMIPVATSKIVHVLMEKANGVYANTDLFKSATGCCRILKDHNFALHSEISEFRHTNGNLHIVADVWFRVTGGGLPKEALSPIGSWLLTALQGELYSEDPLFADFELISANGESLKTSKLLLSLVSPVFRAMLQTDCQEARDGACKIPDADIETIRAMLAFKCGREPDEWTVDIAKSLLSLADKYEILDLKETCSMKLAEMIDPANAADILSLADLHSCGLLKNEVYIYLEDNMEKVTREGTLVRFLDRGVKRPLLEEWQAHLNKRKTGTKWEKPEEEAVSDADSELEELDAAEE